MKMTAAEIARLVGGRVEGAEEREVDGLAALQAASSNHLSFATDAKALAALEESGAGVIIAGEFAAGSKSQATLVLCGDARLAFARAGRAISAPPSPAAGVHPTAVVDPSARLGEGVSVGPHVVIEADVTIGCGVQVGPNVHVCGGVSIGDECVIKANVVIYAGTTLGARVVVHAGTVLGSDGFGFARDGATGRYEAFPQVGRLVVEDDVEFGALCTIDRGALGETRIKRGVKFDNQVHIAHNVVVGEDVVAAAQAGVAGSSVIGDNVIIAGQVGVADHVRVESGAILGAQCGVPTGKVIKGAGVLYWGTPARPIKAYLRELAVLARMAKR